MDAGNRAASVAAELLSFYRAPALVRTRYLHGEIPMPDGAVVFRLALGRFSSEGMESIAAADRAPAQLAAAAFVRQVCLWERSTHYQVLCLEPDAAEESVRENYHLVMALIHPDRHEAEWPAGSAPRVNRAYAVLSDRAEREAYDEQLGKAALEGAVLEGLRAGHAAEPPAHRRAQRRPAPARRVARFAVVAGVVVALFVVQAWWLGADDSQHYSLLERAMPAAERLRDALPDAPRFLGAAFTPGEPLPLIEQPRRMPALASWAPSLDPLPVAQPPAPSASPVQPAAQAASPAQPVQAPLAIAAVTPTPAPAEARPMASPVSTAQAATPPAPRPAQATSPATAQPAAPRERLAQATPVPPASAPAGASPGREQVEDLVALLVSYYDAGDSERLVGLYDPDRLGFWSGMRTRSAYADFFAATRERRLRIDRLTWQTDAGLAQARGEAVVLAEFQDGRPRLERRVPVELDIVLREAQPRIARMVLFPLAQ